MQTRRDGEIVAWIGGLGAAGAEHVAKRFGMNMRIAYRRLQLLNADRLLEHRMLLYGRPGIYCATRRGLRWQGVEYLPVVRATPGGYEHAWQVAATAVALHRHLPGWELLGEREIRVREIASKGELLASAQFGEIAGRPKLHRPDLAAIAPSGRVLAIEVELSVKALARLAQICRAWTRARHVDHVYYLATPKAERAVRRAVRSIKAEDFVTVLPLDGVASLAAREMEPRVGL
jgi:hypothetical protein